MGDKKMTQELTQAYDQYATAALQGLITTTPNLWTAPREIRHEQMQQIAYVASEFAQEMVLIRQDRLRLIYDKLNGLQKETEVPAPVSAHISSNRVRVSLTNYNSPSKENKIILSGPRGSGKTRILEAFALTHPVVYTVLGSEAVKGLAGALKTEKIRECMLLIIEQCDPNMILHIDDILFSDEYKMASAPVVYTTSHDVSDKQPEFAGFRIINCRNACI